jgi:hypothetical protein
MNGIQFAGLLIGMIATLITVIGVIIKMGVEFGKRDATFCALADRVKEDREKNNAQHEAFFATGRAVERVDVDMKNMKEAIDEIKISIKEILDRLPPRGK